jgi:hypothetical protein
MYETFTPIATFKTQPYGYQINWFGNEQMTIDYQQFLETNISKQILNGNVIQYVWEPNEPFPKYKLVPSLPIKFPYTTTINGVVVNILVDNTQLVDAFNLDPKQSTR